MLHVLGFYVASVLEKMLNWIIFHCMVACIVNSMGLYTLTYSHKMIIIKVECLSITLCVVIALYFYENKSNNCIYKTREHNY